MKTIRLLFGLWLLLTSTTLFAEPVTLTFNELTNRAANGVSIAGITFNFTINGIASDQATYGATMPGSTTNVSPPALIGNTAGTLALNFAQATDLLRFGITFNSFNALDPGVTVQLFNSSLAVIGTISLRTQATSSFTEALFNQSGLLISRAVLTFNPSVSTFALDNLSFNSVAIPEPAALILLGSGLAALAALTKKRKKKTKSGEVGEVQNIERR